MTLDLAWDLGIEYAKVMARGDKLAKDVQNADLQQLMKIMDEHARQAFLDGQADYVGKTDSR